MTYDLTITAPSIALALGGLIAGVGLLVNFLQLRRNWRVQKAQFLASITKDLFEDNDLRRFFYEIDYEKFHFDEENLGAFKGSDSERHLDALLYRYNLIGRLVRMGVLDFNETEFLFFEIGQVFKNTDVAKYLRWLDIEYGKHGSIGQSTRKRPYDDARWLVERQSQ